MPIDIRGNNKSSTEYPRSGRADVICRLLLSEWSKQIQTREEVG
jgi:hypothetical protein